MDAPAASPQPTTKREVEPEASASDAKRAKLEHEVNENPSDPASADVLPTPAASSSSQKLHHDGDRRGRKGKKEKGNRMDKRRGTRPAGEVAAPEGAVGEKALRLPKRQCALLIGFCGSGFYGMQIQKDVRTIEGELFKALVTAGAVSKDNADDPVKVGLQRAARTDAGVHAAGNVVSLKLITEVPNVPDLVARINEELPPEIRLWSFQRVQNSFNARMTCDSRKYTYFFPSYLLIPPKPNSALFKSFTSQNQSSSESHPYVTDSFWQDANLDASREKDMVHKKKWRVSPEKIEALRKAAKHFEGTHNFHNFTVGRDVKDKSCMRHMKKIEVTDPVVYGETEWISVMLHGQSFMLHQRKMMCVLVMSVRTGTPSSIIDSLYGSLTVSVPKMPSLGLLLEHPIFESYSKRVVDINKEKKWGPSDADHRAAIDFDRHAEAILKFKEEHIYSRMRESEERVQVFDRWLQTIDHYAGPDLLYFNARGIIPDAAVVKRGEGRAHPFKERKQFDATEFAADAPAATFAEKSGDEMEVGTGEVTMGKRELEEAEG